LQIVVERTRDAQHGDFASNVALRLAGAAHPGDLARAIVEALPPNPLIARAEVAGAGFINIYLTPEAFSQELSAIHESSERYGRSGLGQGVKVVVEFACAPTDRPSHIGHGREEAYSAALANLFAATGFDVHLECYVQSLVDTGAADRALALLEAQGHLYTNDGATWFRGTEFGDSQDRVVVKGDGGRTCFAFDVAHHLEKRERGFGRLVDVLSADHQGHFAQLRAALEAMGERSDGLEVDLVQSVSLVRRRRKIPAVTLRELWEEVGKDACRFFFLLRSHDQPLDFDVDLAKSRTNENPVYYVQYAHARVASVLKQLKAGELAFDRAEGLDNAAALTGEQEQPLLKMLTSYPEIVEHAATNRAPHAVVHYLRELANAFHTYYNAQQLIVPESKIRNARIALALGVQQVIRNGLTLIGVSSPDTM
jgi:arginyl-tRNA synthetase